MVTRKQLEEKYRKSETRQAKALIKLNKELDKSHKKYSDKSKAVVDKESEYRNKLFKQITELDKRSKRKK